VKSSSTADTAGAVPDAPAAPAVARLGWHHLLLDVPADSEVLAYQADPRKGRLVLGDRRGETLQIFWRVTHRTPDPLRGLERVVRALTGDGAREPIFTINGWHACLPERDDLPGLACRYEARSGALLYAVFPRRSHPRPELAILESYHPNDGEERAWAAFGLDVTLPAAFAPAAVRPFPLVQSIRFENPRGESITLCRRSLLSHLPDGDDLAVLYARNTEHKRPVSRTGIFLHDTVHPGVTLAYTTRGKGGLEGLIAPTWQGRVWAWRCPGTDRAYWIDQNAPEKHLLHELQERVRCR